MKWGILPLMIDDTIAAIATANGDGAISIVRISGKDAYLVANKIFSGDVHSFSTHTAHLGRIRDVDGSTIDEVLLLVMEEGKSFTGESSVEIMCHGGQFITSKVLARVLSAGARAAGPGEFSFRAYRNGKLDLIQAEAIASLIAAKSEAAIKTAEKQLRGELSIRIKDLQRSITDICAIIEAWVDYPEEGLEFATSDEMQEMVQTQITKIERLSNSFHEGRIISSGISLCLLGAPNVGKSSLMNALLREDRAIVTEIAGTTRDVLQEEMLLGSLTFRLIDTAGIRNTDEIIEKEGIRRSKLQANSADLVLILLDATRELSDDEKSLIEAYPKALLVYNKIDQAEKRANELCISAKTGEGIDDLKMMIEKIVLSGLKRDPNDSIITKERHYQALLLALSSLKQVQEGLKNSISPEFLALDLRASLKELASIIGTNVTEDILSAIFSKFCVGK